MEWFTEAEAADYLKITENSLRILRYKGRIPSGKIAGVVQYKKQDLDDHRAKAFEKGRAKWAENQKALSSKNTTGHQTGTLPEYQGTPKGSARMKKAARKLNSAALSLSLSLVKDSNKRTNSRLATV